MKRNEGKVDRVIRVTAGVLMLSQVFMGLNTVLGYVGLVPLVTGIVGFCPLYAVFGINTCALNRDKFSKG